MLRINLFFEKFSDKEILQKIKNHEVIRLKGMLQFKSRNGWTKPYQAVIDTGAHTSVIPISSWENVNHEKFGEYKMFGISKNQACSISAEIGKVTCIMIDEEGNQSEELNVISLLASTDAVPLIIGFKDALQKFRLISDYEKNIAFLEK